MDRVNTRSSLLLLPCLGSPGMQLAHAVMINLSLSLGEVSARKTRIISFVIVEVTPVYNVILGRPVMTTFMAVASALHQK